MWRGGRGGGGGGFLEKRDNLPGPISVFGDNYFFNRSHFLLAFNTKL